MQDYKNYLLFTDNFQAAKEEIIKVGDGGWVSQRFTHKVFLATFPAWATPHFTEFCSLTEPANLDEVSKLMANAWRGVPTTPLPPVNTTGVPHPQYPGNKDELRKRFEALKQTFITRRRNQDLEQIGNRPLIGTVGLGLLLVSGPGDLALLPDEIMRICAGVMRGLDLLIKARGRTDLSFYYEYHFLSINSPNVPGCITPKVPDGINSTVKPPWEACEEAFVGPALKVLSNELGRNTPFQDGDPGIVEYNEAIKTAQQAGSAYTAFFTKYQLDGYAYGNGPGTAVFMDPSSEQYQSTARKTLISNVFAHETCHMFGAADEYSEHNYHCPCGQFGVLNVPNNNCVECKTTGFNHVNCLMDDIGKNEICSWTKGQLGWLNPKPKGNPSAAQMSNSMNVVYRDMDDEISLIAFKVPEAAAYTSLSLDLPEAPPKANGNPCTFTDSGNNVHLFYRDINNEIAHIFSCDGGWGYENVHKMCPTAPKIKGNPSAVAGRGGFHVVYTDVDGYVAYLLWNSASLLWDPASGWFTYALIVDKHLLKTGGDPRIVYYNVDHYNNENLYVIYRDLEDGIRAIMWEGGHGWVPRDLSQLANSRSTSGDPSIIQLGSMLYVVFKNKEDGITGIWCDRISGVDWRFFPISQGIQGFRRAIGEPSIVGFNSALRIAYTDQDQEISYLERNGGGTDFTYHKLSDLVKTATPKAQGNPCIAVYGDSLEIIYRDENNRISDGFWSPDHPHWHYLAWNVDSKEGREIAV